MSSKSRSKGSTASPEKFNYTPAPQYLRTVKLRTTAARNAQADFLLEDSHDDLSIDMHTSASVNLRNAIVRTHY